MEFASLKIRFNKLSAGVRAHWLLVLTGLAIVAAAVWYYRADTTVTLVEVKRGTAVEIVYATGVVEPVVWAKITPIVKGRIVERCRCEGKHVQAGDLLARLDDVEAQANLRELRAREEFLRRDHERQTQLALKGYTSEQALQKIDSDLRQMQAQIAAQMERLVYYRILAPMDGVVLREDGEVGEIVDSNTILYRIGNPRPLQIVAEVNEDDIPRVKIGQAVLLRSDAFAGQQLSGAVREVTPAGDTLAKTFRIRIALPDDTPFHVGMSAEANVITMSKDNVLLVPAAAVRANAVFVVEGRRAIPRPVKLGIRGTQFVEIVSGLVEGDRVISPQPAELRARQRVRFERAAAQ